MKFQGKDLVYLRDIIIRAPIALERWGQIVDHIVEAEVDKAKIKKLLRDAEYAEAVLQGVQKWHLHRRELDLAAVLRNHAMNNLANEIENLDISGSAHCTPPPTPGALTGIGFQMSDAVPNFVGRESELRKLHSLLLRPQPAFLTGLVGVGKSELARAYAHRNQSLYDGNIIFIRGHSIESMRTGFSALAATLSLPMGRNVTHKIAQAVYDKFHQSNSKCLFVFDGVEDLEDFNLFKPVAKHEANWTPPAVLVTTRRAVVREDNRLGLQVMSKADAVEFVQNELRGASEQDSLALAEQVGCYPLALQQCSSQIRAQKMTIQDYIEKYLKPQPGFLSSMSNVQFPAFKAYGMTTSRAVETVISKLEVEIPLVRKLLQSLSCLNAGVGVSMEFLQKFNKNCLLFDELEATIRALEDQSLVTLGGNMKKVRVAAIVQRLMSADPSTSTVAGMVYKFMMKEMRGNIPAPGKAAGKTELMKECTTHALFHFPLFSERISELEAGFLYHIYCHLIHFDMLDEALFVASESYAACKGNESKPDTTRLLQLGVRYAEVEYQLKHFGAAHRVLEEIRPYSDGNKHQQLAIEAAIGRLHCAQGEAVKAGQAFGRVLKLSDNYDIGEAVKF